MSTFTQWILLPVFTSIVGGVIVIVIQRYFTDWNGGISFLGFPIVAGKYKVTYPNNPEYGIEYANVKQFGSRLTGTIKYPDEELPGTFTGKISRTGFITYHFAPKNYSTNEYGAGFLKLSKYFDESEGYVLFLDDNSQQITSVGVHLKKIA